MKPIVYNIAGIEFTENEVPELFQLQVASLEKEEYGGYIRPPYGRFTAGQIKALHIAKGISQDRGGFDIEITPDRVVFKENAILETPNVWRAAINLSNNLVKVVSTMREYAVSDQLCLGV